MPAVDSQTDIALGWAQKVRNARMEHVQRAMCDVCGSQECFICTNIPSSSSSFSSSSFSSPSFCHLTCSAPFRSWHLDRQTARSRPCRRGRIADHQVAGPQRCGGRTRRRRLRGGRCAIIHTSGYVVIVRTHFTYIHTMKIENCTIISNGHEHRWHVRLHDII